MLRLLPALIAASLGCSAVTAASPQATVPYQAAKRDALGTYIVTFKEPALAVMAERAPRLFAKSGKAGDPLDVQSKAAIEYRTQLAVERHAHLTRAQQLLGRQVAPMYVYDLALNGVALSLTRAEAIKLAGLPGVAKVEQEQVFRPTTDRGPAYIGAPAIWTGPAGIANRGEGVVVGVVDGGINPSHPSFAAVGPVDGFVHANPRSQFFGRCETTPSECNAKLIGIYDFTEEGAQNGVDLDGHGTHVASTAIGNYLTYDVSGTATQISGVAPHAAVISYKVCISDDPDTEDDEAACQGGPILAALDQAIEDGVDVINFSIGGGVFDPWTCIGEDCDGDGDSEDIETSSEAFLSVHAAGIVAVTSAGNDGPDAGTVSAPGLSPWMITVAAIKHDRIDGDGGELAEFSSRGPGPVGGYLVPDVSAPGVMILAASDEGEDAMYMSGTSMASPHVAGGAALLIAAHPDWTVGDISSALVTTARPEVRLADGITPAALFEQGAGVVDLSKAVNAGLSLRIGFEDYLAGHPRFGGTISGINEPALILDQCFLACTSTRTFTDLIGGGTWKVIIETEPGVIASASPSEFTIAAGGSQEVTFTVNAEARAGEWTYGAVRLQRVGGNTPEARLPLGVFGDPGPLPAEIVIEADSDAGFVDIQVPGLIGLPGASFATTGLAEVFSRTETLAQDPTRDTPYDAYGGQADGTFLQWVDVPANSGVMTLRVETPASSSDDVDLFVGRDISLNGAPDTNEELCVSASPDEQELCEVEVGNRGQPTRYWILVQNWDAGGDTDEVTVRWTLADADASGEGALTVTGPGHVSSGQPFTIRVSWKDLTLKPGEQREGFLLIGATPDRLGQTGRVPLTLVRSAATNSAAAALVPEQAIDITLVPGEAEERLYVDVPANASAMTITLDGTGEVDVFAAHAPDATGPVIVPAPARAAAQASSSAAGASDSLVVSGAALQPGRWYITPVNEGGAAATFSMNVEFDYDAARPQTKSGAWYNPDRSGAGGFLYRASGAWAFIWYSFFEDGTPTWYLGVSGEPGAQDGSWVVPLERYSWDGDSAISTRVGEGVLTLIDATTLQFSWNIDGQSGSERYFWIDGGGCPDATPKDLTGSWFAPALSGYGYSVNAYAGLETNAAYFYDALGVPRWAFGAVTPFGEDTIVLEQYQGVGPLAAYQAPTSTPVGTYARTYTSATAGQATLDVELLAPLSGSWNTAHDIVKLTDSLGCD